MEKNTKHQKILLAYSGGLDTSVIIRWLLEHYDAEVIAAVADVGQVEDMAALEKRALATGASEFYALDMREEFVDEYVIPAVQAEAKYQGNYLLGTALARPLIAKKLVELAKQTGATALAHGCTGKGNDQVRFELGFKHFAPELEIIAPWRVWELDSREAIIEYAAKHNIDLGQSASNGQPKYSEDENVYHISHEGLELEEITGPADYSRVLTYVTPLEQTPAEGEVITLTFEHGKPIALNGEKLSSLELLAQLNQLGAKHGVGVDDIMEDRLVGMKIRGVYENPGAAIMYTAHHYLEAVTLDKDTLKTKRMVGDDLADQIYNALWFTPLTDALRAFVDSTQQYVNGDVTVKLYKGHVINYGINTPYSLYDEDYATFGADGIYDHADASGFINLYSIPTLVHAKRAQKLADQK